MIPSQIRPLALSVLIAAATPSIVHAASFDCSAASSKVEGIVCSNAYISHLDDLLADDYAKVKAINPNAVTEQRAWIATRNECDSTQCVMNAYTQRDSQLHYQLETAGRVVQPAPAQAASGEALDQGETDVSAQPRPLAQQVASAPNTSFAASHNGRTPQEEAQAQQMQQPVPLVNPTLSHEHQESGHDVIGIGVGVVIVLSIIGAIFKYFTDRRCPSCGKWAARVTESSQEIGSSVRYEQHHLTDTYRNRTGEVTGTKERTEILPVKYTAYRHHNRCKYCGYVWQSESESRSKFQ